jgi:hypothetical protein
MNDVVEGTMASMVPDDVTSRPATDPDADAALLSLLERAGPRVRRAFDRAGELRLQILVTEVLAGANFANAGTSTSAHESWPLCATRPPAARTGDIGAAASRRTRTASFRAGAEYIYPASTIKLPTAICVLRAIQDLQAAGGTIDARTPLRFHPAFSDQVTEDRDPTNLGYAADATLASPPGSLHSEAPAPHNPPSPVAGTFCVEHEIRKSLIVSDNPAHNRLYTIVGHERVNRLCREMGLSSALINHRLSEFRTRDEQRRTGRVEFLANALAPDERVLATIPERDSTLMIENPPTLQGLSLGHTHVINGVTHHAPMDFSWRNRLSLHDIQRSLMLVVRPDLINDARTTGLSERHRLLLCGALWPFARQSTNPVFPRDEFRDLSTKYCLHGLRRHWADDDFVIFNKVGQAYGFTIENAYVVHRTTGRAFFIAISLYANASGVIGADTYDDISVSIPLIADITEAVAIAPLAG